MATARKVLVDSSKVVNSLRDNYVGEKRNHLRDGYGVYKYENKYFKYEGQWKTGKKHGHGKLLMKDGTFYEGEFKDGEITGHGFKYWSSSRNTYSGQFYLGELEGDGVMRYSDGSLYEGQWRNNKREGQGKLTQSDGSFYEGEFHNNKAHGEGKNFSSDGSVYEGGYINGKRHGHGVYKMTDGSVFDGQWSNDIFNGEGIMMHSSGFTYEGLWVNGKPAQMASRIEIVGVDTAVGITITQGQSFDLKLQTVDEDGELSKDNGREFKVSAGYKYEPRPQSKESNLFEAIEDAEENLIQTPLGYTILPYPISDQPLNLTLSHEDTDLSSITRANTLVEQDESSQGEPPAVQLREGEDDSRATEEQTASNSPPPTGEDLLIHQAPRTVRAEDGEGAFTAIVFLPPPPLYRPFQQLAEKAGSDSKTKQTNKKHSTAKQSATGTYVLMIEDVTDPPFLGTSLPTVFTIVTIKKKRREPTIVKDKAPKWDTSKHIAATVAMHREDTFKREASQFSEASMT